MLRKIRLYGALGAKYGREFKISAFSVVEGVRLVAAQIPGLYDAIREGRFHVTVGDHRRRGVHMDEGTIEASLPAGDIHITPALRGGKTGGLGKILVGTLLVAASFFVPVGGTFLASVGLSMALAGVSSLLAGQKKAQKQKRSYMDSGQQTSDQGGCVPIVIGRFMATPKIISAGVTVNDSNGYA